MSSTISTSARRTFPLSGLQRRNVSAQPSIDENEQVTPQHLQNPLHPLSESQIMTFSQIFMTKVDTKLSGAVPISALPDLLMSCGLFYIQPSLKSKYMAKFESKYGDYIELVDFLKLVASQLKAEKRLMSYETLKDAFAQVFDTTGGIVREELEFVLQYLGEPLKEDELERMISVANMEGNTVIDYEEFCRVILELE